eukprot:6911835-Pyramimonas_sp.AAC.1
MLACWRYRRSARECLRRRVGPCLESPKAFFVVLKPSGAVLRQQEDLGRARPPPGRAGPSLDEFDPGSLGAQ